MSVSGYILWTHLFTEILMMYEKKLRKNINENKKKKILFGKLDLVAS